MKIKGSAIHPPWTINVSIELKSVITNKHDTFPKFA